MPQKEWSNFTYSLWYVSDNISFFNNCHSKSIVFIVDFMFRLQNFTTARGPSRMIHMVAAKWKTVPEMIHRGRLLQLDLTSCIQSAVES